MKIVPNLKDVTLNEGLKTIKPAAFKNTALTTVSIPSTVTNVNKNNKSDVFDDGDEIIFIGNKEPEDTNQYVLNKSALRTLAKDKTGTITFSTTPLAEGTVGTDLSEAGDGSIIGVEDVEDVTIYSKNGKTYAPEDSSYIFMNFKGNSINLSGFDTSNVTNMWTMFNSCFNLTELDLSNFDTSNVTDMNAMFDGCSNLTILDISSFDTTNVKAMPVMFAGCSKLTTLIVNHFDTSNVTDMSDMFSFCSSLDILDVSNFNTSNVTDMSRMFQGCTFLNELDLSNFDFSNAELVVDDIIADCDILETLIVNTYDDQTIIESIDNFPASCTITVKEA